VAVTGFQGRPRAKGFALESFDRQDSASMIKVNTIKTISYFTNCKLYMNSVDPPFVEVRVRRQPPFLPSSQALYQRLPTFLLLTAFLFLAA